MITLSEVINLIDINENDYLCLSLDEDSPHWKRVNISFKGLKKYLNKKKIKVTKIGIVHKLYGLCNLKIIVNGISLEELREIEQKDQEQRL